MNSAKLNMLYNRVMLIYSTLKKKIVMKSKRVASLNTFQPVGEFFSRCCSSFAFKNNIQVSDCILFILLGCILVLSFVMALINAYETHYQATIMALYLQAVPGVCLVYCLLVGLRGTHYRALHVMQTIVMSYFIIVFTFIAAGAIIQTPFAVIDGVIKKWDSAMGFNVTHWMSWGFQFPRFIQLLKFCYQTWFYQFFLVPAVLAYFHQHRIVAEYYIATLLTLIVGGAIYYFFPTTAPATVYHSVYFSVDQHNLVTVFNQLHHHQTVTVSSKGLVSFPSFHVIGAILALLALRRLRPLFWGMMIVNALLIVATMVLGYHYLSDVLAGAVLAFSGNAAAKRLLTWGQRFSLARRSGSQT